MSHSWAHCWCDILRKDRIAVRKQNLLLDRFLVRVADSYHAQWDPFQLKFWLGSKLLWQYRESIRNACACESILLAVEFCNLSCWAEVHLDPPWGLHCCTQLCIKLRKVEFVLLLIVKDMDSSNLSQICRVDHNFGRNNYLVTSIPVSIIADIWRPSKLIYCEYIQLSSFETLLCLVTFVGQIKARHFRWYINLVFYASDRSTGYLLLILENLTIS